MKIGEIINLCADGDVIQLRQKLQSWSKEGICTKDLVNTPAVNGRTCLIAACRNGHLEVVKYLIDCEADIEQVGTVTFDGETVEGVPPLWCAAGANHLTVVRYLVEHGASVNRTTVTNSTALRAACFDGHENVVRYLVEIGADVETPNRHGHTCLMIACFRGFANIARYLINQGARVNRLSAKGNTALHDCAESGNLHCLGLLLRHGALMRQDEYGQSPIMSGANSNFKKIVDFLSELRKPGHMGQAAEDFLVPIAEQAAAHELLGAVRFDRDNLVQDAMKEWLDAMELRRRHFGYSKRLPPPPPPAPSSRGEASVPDHYLWSLIGSRVVEAVQEETDVRRAGKRVTLKRRVQRDLLCRVPKEPPTAIQKSTFWLRRYEALSAQLSRQYQDLLTIRGILSSSRDRRFHNSVGGSTTTVPSRELTMDNLEEASAADAALGVEPSIARRHRRRPLEGEPSDLHEQPPLGRLPSPLFSSPQNLDNLSHDVYPDAHNTWWEDAPTTMEEDSERHPMVQRVKAFCYRAFGAVREIANANELGCVSYDQAAFQMQSLLIRLRILGPDHPDTIYFIRFRGATCADSGKIPQCLSFWRCAIELQRVFFEPMCQVSQTSFLAFAELFHLILRNRLTDLQAVDIQPSLIVDCIDLAVENIERGIEYSYWNWHNRVPWSYVTADKEAVNLLRHVCLCIHFASLICFYFCDPTTSHLLLPRRHRRACLRDKQVFSGRAFPMREMVAAVGSALFGGVDESPVAHGLTFVPTEREHSTMRSKMTPQLTGKFFRILNRLIRIDPRVHDGQSLLHLACSSDSCKIGRCWLFPSPYLDVVRLFCALGADPDTLDARNVRPLGVILAGRLRRTNEALWADFIAGYVNDTGAHLDACVRPAPSLPLQQQQHRSTHDDDDDDDTSTPLQSQRLTDATCASPQVVKTMTLSRLRVRPLKCLAACALPRAQRQEDVLADLSGLQHLSQFVKLHHP